MSSQLSQTGLCHESEATDETPDEQVSVIDHLRMIILTGDLNESSTATLVGTLIELDRIDQTVPIDMIISTYGGSVDEMFAIYDVMKFIRCPVRTIGVGKIMSAGVLLLAAGTKGLRVVGQHARLMLHQMSSIVHGNVFQHANEMTEITRMQSMIEECIISETKLTEKKLSVMMSKGTDHYISALEAQKYGFVDYLF